MSIDDELTDALVREAARGDQAALDALLEQHRNRLRRMVALRMHPRLVARLDASDIVQEALLAASKQLGHYAERPPMPFYLWLRRFAWQQLAHEHQRHLDAQKRTVRREQLGLGETSDRSVLEIAKQIAGGSTSPTGRAQRNELQFRVRAALQLLPEIDREILLQRYVEQLSIKEIAAALGATEAAVYKRHARALRKVHGFLEERRPCA